MGPFPTGGHGGTAPTVILWFVVGTTPCGCPATPCGHPLTACFSARYIYVTRKRGFLNKNFCHIQKPCDSRSQGFLIFHRRNIRDLSSRWFGHFFSCAGGKFGEVVVVRHDLFQMFFAFGSSGGEHNFSVSAIVPEPRACGNLCF